MHMITIVAAGSALAPSVAANAQDSADDPSPERDPVLYSGIPAARLKAPSVLVVDIGTLPRAR